MKGDGIVKRAIKILVLVAVMFMLTFSAFGAGIVLGQAGKGTESASAAPALCTVEADSHGSCLTAEGEIDFDTFWQAWNIVQEEFIDREALEEKDLEYGAIRGMLEALGDEGHTTFLTPEQLTRQRSDISGKFQGIGAYVGMENGLPIIVAPFEGSPAERAGILAGDMIMEVDGEDVTTWTINDIVDVIRGEAGTEVVLTVLRPEVNESPEITITRGEITIPAATWAMIPGTDVAMVRLGQFNANANKQITNAIREAEAAGATSLVVDLRNNPGGLLEQVIKVTSQFVEGGNVLQQEDARGNRKPYPDIRGGVALDVPMVLLVNEGSASSSEIFAGAIQDHERGVVVGETTFGTGTVLEPYILDDGSGMMLGTSQWLTADGRLIRKQGIEPDITVELPMTADLLYPRDLEDLTVTELLEGEDTQLLKALELLEALPEE
jgi:carboxyl-terminal processing protease